MPTPHIGAEPEDFAEAVLLPGDPLRARYIAENFLEESRQVTSVRNMLGFTGSYQGMGVSVMGTGMGVPSASIYFTELIDHFGARRLVRVGSCGALQDHIKIRDVILAVGACTDSGVNRVRYRGYDFAATADFGLLTNTAWTGGKLGISFQAGNVHTADLFYNPDPAMFGMMEKMGVLAVEMEAAGLYGVAAERGARALTVLTVSDHVKTGEQTNADERQETFDEMVKLALEGLLLDQQQSC